MPTSQPDLDNPLIPSDSTWCLFDIKTIHHEESFFFKKKYYLFYTTKYTNAAGYHLGLGRWKMCSDTYQHSNQIFDCKFNFFPSSKSANNILIVYIKHFLTLKCVLPVMSDFYLHSSGLDYAKWFRWLHSRPLKLFDVKLIVYMLSALGAQQLLVMENLFSLLFTLTFCPTCHMGCWA